MYEIKVFEKLNFSSVISVKEESLVNPSAETQGQSSVGLGEKVRRKFSSTGRGAPWVPTDSPDHFQVVNWMLAPDYSHKKCFNENAFIVPNQWTASPEFFSCVRTWWLLSPNIHPVHSPRLCVRTRETSFSTFLTRKELGNTNDTGKHLRCYQ